jgi:hypothetical protein
VCAVAVPSTFPKQLLCERITFIANLKAGEEARYDSNLHQFQIAVSESKAFVCAMGNLQRQKEEG